MVDGGGSVDADRQVAKAFDRHDDAYPRDISQVIPDPERGSNTLDRRVSGLRLQWDAYEHILYKLPDVNLYCTVLSDLSRAMLRLVWPFDGIVQKHIHKRLV